jgi:two-component system, chemotaxis family, chemotaxis protein CheY
MLNVLVVDDSSVMRSMIIKTLRMSRVSLGKLLEAENGEAGLKLLESNWIDLALIDVHMPVMDGEEMVRRVRKNELTSSLPVLVVTSESNSARVERLRKLGVSIIRKPFTPESLKRTILQVTGAVDETDN